MVVTDSCATGSMWAQELMRERGCALCHIMVPQEGGISLPPQQTPNGDLDSRLSNRCQCDDLLSSG